MSDNANQQSLQKQAEQKQIEQQAFERLAAMNAVGEKGEGFVNRLFKPFFAPFNTNSNSWESDAQQVFNEQKVIRAKALLYGVGLTIVLLIVWAALAQIDEVTRGEGKVIPSRQLQVVQSMDGGLIQNIYVEEGDTVKQGDLLARIDPTRFVASFEEGSVRVFALQAEVNRLRAQITGEPLVLNARENLNDKQRQVLEQERNYYQSSKKELKERLSVARGQLEQKQQELSEAKARLEATSKAYEITTKELEATMPLLQTGAVSQIDILRLQREQSTSNGERLQAQARVRQVEASISEAKSKLLEAGTSLRNQWRAQLSDASSKLNSLNKSVEGLADKVKLSELRSPVNGTVQRLLFNTIGAVVQPGNAVVEIVPSDDRLLVEAKIAPKDIAFLRPGLSATIKLHAYDFAIYGGIEAELQHISADTITDDRDNTFYLVRAITSEQSGVKNMDVIPGMTAQLDILTGKKSILSYILKPLLRAKANALSER